MEMQLRSKGLER